MAPGLDASQIRTWRSIVTLITFVITNIIVLFPFHVPLFVPRVVWNLAADALSWLRVIPPRCEKHVTVRERDSGLGPEDGNSRFIRVRFHLNFVTAPLAADLLLLALGAIGRREVHDGTIGADNISPIDVMGFFITLAYIAISIDASGLIRYLSYRILQWSRQNVRWGGGRWLFLYLYTFFFVLGTLVGNDPIVLSGTAFLAYMTRAARNIEHPRAWIFSQFAIANVASAILVSSNPTNLVLAGAFEIRFIDYTANMVVPVVITALLLFPFLLFVVFNDRRLVPREIEIHEAPTNANRDTTSSRSSGAQHGLDAASNLNSALDVRRRSTAGTLRPPPVNPNIPYARQAAALDEDPDASDPESSAALPLDEVLNPWVDRTGAIVGSVVMLVTLATVLALNATLADKTHLAVSWVTAPAAVIMLCWDLASGWRHRKETRAIARASKERIERFRARTASGTRQIRQPIELDSGRQATDLHVKGEKQRGELAKDSKSQEPSPVHFTLMDEKARESNYDTEAEAGRSTLASSSFPSSRTSGTKTYSLTPDISRMAATPAVAGEFCPPTSAYTAATHQLRRKPATLLFLAEDLAAWARETFPTATTVLSELPYALVPFAFSMFVLVQALVTNGWVPVFAYGWDRWVDRTGTIGAIGGMGFISVMLCNFAGTNIGTTILLSRILQAWQTLHLEPGAGPISDRTFWAAVYAMAVGVNYGAFSISFSAALAGLLWRDILSRKHVFVRASEFAKINVPIIAVSMIVGCAILLGEVYLVRTEEPYHL